jgi:hypothetical protein
MFTLAMESYDPPDPWGWCFIDEEMLDFSDNPTPHLPDKTTRRTLRARKKQR